MLMRPTSTLTAATSGVSSARELALSSSSDHDGDASSSRRLLAERAANLTVGRAVPEAGSALLLAPSLESPEHLALQRAALSPYASRDTRLVAVTPLQSRRSVTATEWNCSPVLRDAYWCCKRCDVVMPNAEPRCRECTADKDTMNPYASRPELEAIDQVASSCSYGRSLKCTQGRMQTHAEGAAALPGTAEYVLSTLASTPASLLRSF